MAFAKAIFDVHVVISQPITAQRGIMSEHNSSFVGCINPTMNRIKSLLKDCASGVFKYCKMNHKLILFIIIIMKKKDILYFETILGIVYDDQIELKK